MEGADDGNIQSRGLLQQILDLLAVLAHNADVVAAGLVIPRLLHIQGAEFAEAVGGEEDLIIGIVSHDDFGPVDHGRGDKSQHMLAQVQGVALAHHDAAVSIVGAEEILHHGKRLGGGDHNGLRVQAQEFVDVGGVVRLHMLNHQEVGLPAGQSLFHIVQPLMGEVCIHGVHDGHLLVQNGVGIVSHAVRHHILALKEVHFMVVDADIANIVGNKHRAYLLYVSVLAGLLFDNSISFCFDENRDFITYRSKFYRLPSFFALVISMAPRVSFTMPSFWK